MSKSLPWLLVLVPGIFIAAAPARAGVLAGDTTSYQSIWHGTSAFSSGGLAGTVDWAVYGPGSAPAGFAGYALTPGELIYCYQVFVTGDDVSTLQVHVGNAAHSIGTFTATSIDASDAPIFAEITGVPGDAIWYFAGIAPGSDSTGLVFSSPNVPMIDSAIVLDGGQSDKIAVPSTSPAAIPEPASLLVWSVLVVLGTAWSFHRARIRSCGDAVGALRATSGPPSGAPPRTTA